MLSLNYENINYVTTQIFKLSCASFSYVNISYVLAEIIPNDWTLEGKNRTLGGGGRGVQKSSDIINGRSFPKRKFMNFENWCN